MIFDNFKIYAIPGISDAYCKGCGEEMKQVSNGLLSRVMYCPRCESVYQLKLVKVPGSKITKEFLKQCRQEVERK